MQQRVQQWRALSILIRLPNLVFIFLTQVLAYYFVLQGDQVGSYSLAPFDFYCLGLSTVFIATAGYIINDYFDIAIDTINKPDRVTIERYFKRRSIIVTHIVLNVVGFLLAAFVAWHSQALRLTSIQGISILLLLVYSTTFKRKLVIGNLIIAVLTAGSLFTIFMYMPKAGHDKVMTYGLKMFWVYVIFSFIITLCREMIKDIEDIKGDGARNCRTIPLVWGIHRAKQLVYGLLLLLIGVMVFVMSIMPAMPILLSISWILLIILPLLITIYFLQKATHAKHFHRVSTYIKWITFAGIISMLLVHCS
jgi:4-hydroxybenzoate polyprenyltransferase